MSKMIQIRNVPDALHRTLKVRAAQASMTLSDYLLSLLSEIEQIAKKLTLSEMMERLRGREPVELDEPPRRQTLRGILAEERGATVLQDLESIRMIRYPHAPLLERIWNLRGNLTAYDAAYIALAEALDAPLVTTDTWLA